MPSTFQAWQIGIIKSEYQYVHHQYNLRILNSLFIVAFTAGLFVSSSIAAPASRPNVLLIMTDDQGWGDLRCHGNETISTPNIDRFASQSIQLQRFFVSPVCAPTRAALLTGRYPERSGVAGVTGRREVMRADETTLAELFRDAGYATGCFGKWHNGAQMPLHPNGQGFDEFFGFCGGHTNLYDDPVLERNGTPVKTKGYITDLLTDAAIDFLKRPHQTPFFCYIPYNAPHGPFQVRKDLFDKYNTGDVSERTAAVYAMVENIDSNVARLLDTLKRQEQAEHTIVIFLTDNGPNGRRFNGGMRGIKGSVHEGGTRVPCFVRWPGQLAPQKIEQVAAHIDLLPTLVELCRLENTSPKPLDGKSLVQLFRDGADPALADRSILTYRPNKSDLARFAKAAVRNQRYRLTIENRKASLFDMQADPGQRTDIASQLPTVTAKLTAQIEAYVAQVTPSITAPRPVPISGDRPTYIPAVDAILKGNPGFADNIAWAHSWVDHWTDKTDRISWPVEFLQPGRYQITLETVCDSDRAQVTAKIGQHSLKQRLSRFPSNRRIRPDLDSESTPRRMQTFQNQVMGELDITAGPTTITLFRTDDDQSMIELGGITITLIAKR